MKSIEYKNLKEGIERLSGMMIDDLDLVIAAAEAAKAALRGHNIESYIEQFAQARVTLEVMRNRLNGAHQNMIVEIQACAPPKFCDCTKPLGFPVCEFCETPIYSLANLKPT